MRWSATRRNLALRAHCNAVAYFADWPVATIDSRFGGIPAGLPGLHFPPIPLELMRDLTAAPAF